MRRKKLEDLKCLQNKGFGTSHMDQFPDSQAIVYIQLLLSYKHMTEQAVSPCHKLLLLNFN